MNKPRFSPKSPYVWIQDHSHRFYPNYVRVLEVMPDGRYRVQIQTSVGKNVSDGPVDILTEEQLSDDVIGG